MSQKTVVHNLDGSITVIDTRTLEDAKAQALAALAQTRWNASLSCLYTVSGTAYTVPCDGDGQTNILGAVVGLQAAGSTGPILWKFNGSVFVSLSLSDIIAMGQAVRAHIQDCFDYEATLTAKINAAPDNAGVDAIDTSSGWPT